jgi:ankyrin repeat protein
MGGKAKFIEMLLDSGANPDTADSEGVTPLSGATLANSPADLAPLKLLLTAKADPNGGTCNAPLLCAINNRNIQSTELLLHAGANPNLKGLIDGNLKNLSRDGYNYTTPLWSAVTMNDAPIAQLLLTYKADPNDTQINNTPLIFSAVDKSNVLQLLLTAGANPNVTNDNGRTPLSFAAEKDSPEAIKLLLAARADPNGGTLDAPLLRAINAVDPASAELLLQAGAAPNRESTAADRSETPLSLAIETHQVPMARLLLKYSANPNDSRMNNSPLIFQALSDTNILQTLLDGGANPNVRNANGKTPLMLAEDAASGNINIDPKTPQPAANDSRSDIDLLREHGALEVLPDWDHISVSRTAKKYSATIFNRGTNEWNQFTLYDLLGVQYDLSSASVRGNWSQDSWTYNLNPVNNSLSFPDFSRIVIHRPQRRGTSWTNLKIDLAHALGSGECAADVPLQFGDVVEVPESDHVVNAPWIGLTTNQLMTLAHCLTRHLQINIDGTTTNLTIGPQVDMGGSWHSQFNSYDVSALVKLTLQGFMLWPVLEDSQLLLSTSDLSHVHVKRHDTTTGQIHEWTVDCSDPNSAPDFWLQDGDSIEVPNTQ